jgi:hypothetical protein
MLGFVLNLIFLNFPVINSANAQSASDECAFDPTQPACIDYALPVHRTMEMLNLLCENDAPYTPGI